MKPIICVGHAALDYVYRIEAFPPEPTKVRSLEHIESGGGMAANAAATIARLGGQGRTVEPHRRRQRRRAHPQVPRARTGSISSYVRTYEHARSSTSAVIVDDNGERLIIGERDHAMPMDASWLPIERIAGAAAVVSDLRWVEGTREAFTAARANGRADAARRRPRRRRPPGRVPLPRRLRDLLGAGARCVRAGPRASARNLNACWRRASRHAGVTRGAEGYAWLSRERLGRVPAGLPRRDRRHHRRGRCLPRRLRLGAGQWRCRRPTAPASLPRRPPSNAAAWAPAPACQRAPKSMNSSPHVWIEPKSRRAFGPQGMDGGRRHR